MWFYHTAGPRITLFYSILFHYNVDGKTKSIPSPVPIYVGSACSSHIYMGFSMSQGESDAYIVLICVSVGMCECGEGVSVGGGV